MIQIYSPSNTNYENNGECALMPASCEIEAELNGSWTLTLAHPLDDEDRWKYIEENAVLKVPTWMGNRLQRYRIRTVEKTDTLITATAYPVFFDSANDAFIINIRITGKTASQALALLFAAAPAKYTYTTDAYSVGSYDFENCNLMEALTGGFRDNWGGEALYDNNHLYIYDEAGDDNGVSVEYGKNITGIEYSVDMTDVVTRIIPYAYNGRMISGNSPWVDSPLINTYPKVFTIAMQFDNIKLSEDASEEDADDDSITICQNQAALNAALSAACTKYYTDGGDKPKISMTVDMLALADTEEYAGFSGLEQIRLGDTVHCRHSKLGIVSDARAVGITWDCVRDRIASVTLGDFEYDYLKDNSDIAGIRKGLEQIAKSFYGDGSIKAEKIRGIINGMNTQLQAQYTAAERQNVLAILFENTDPQSPLYGALGIGTQGIQIAKTKDAYGSWVWTTAATANGIMATNVLVGLISNKSATNWWDLDNDEMHITASYFRLLSSSGGQTSYKTIEEIAAAEAADVFNDEIADFTPTQQKIFDALFPVIDQRTGERANGAVIIGNQLFVNASMINSGYISSARIEAGSITADKLSVADLAALQAKIGNFNITNTVKTTAEADAHCYQHSLYVHYYGVERTDDGSEWDCWYEAGMTGMERADYPIFYIKRNRSVYRHNTGTVYYLGWNVATNPRLEDVFKVEKDGALTANRIYNFDNLHTGGGELHHLRYLGVTSAPASSALIFNIKRIISRTETDEGQYLDATSEIMSVYGDGRIYMSLTSRSGTVLVRDNNNYIGLQTSSSIRYKEVLADSADITDFYNLTAKLAKYKDGYLPEDDQLAGKAMPMLIAEEVDAICHEAALHNSDGTVEDWNYRILIPVHQQMLVEQHKQIISLQKQVSDLEERIERLEKLLRKGGEL